MTDAHEASGEHVQKETPQELCGGKSHLALLATVGIVLPAKGDTLVVYLCFSLACIPDVIAASNIYERYGGSFFLFFSLLCGAIALYAATEANAARAVAFGRLARLGLGVCAISFTLGQILLPRETAHLVPKWIPPNQMFWAILAGGLYGANTPLNASVHTFKL